MSCLSESTTHGLPQSLVDDLPSEDGHVDLHVNNVLGIDRYYVL